MSQKKFTTPTFSLQQNLAGPPIGGATYGPENWQGSEPLMDRAKIDAYGCSNTPSLKPNTNTRNKYAARHNSAKNEQQSNTEK